MNKKCGGCNVYSPESINEMQKLAEETIETAKEIMSPKTVALPNQGKIFTYKEAVGVKYDAGKSRLDLIPHEALEELGKVLAFGANKYTAGNWANGINYSRLIAAAFRHLSAFNGGEDLDPESGLCHIDHAMCNLAFLSWMRRHRADLDDRWIKGVQQKDSK